MRGTARALCEFTARRQVPIGLLQAQRLSSYLSDQSLVIPSCEDDLTLKPTERPKPRFLCLCEDDVILNIAVVSCEDDFIMKPTTVSYEDYLILKPTVVSCGDYLVLTPPGVSCDYMSTV